MEKSSKKRAISAQDGESADALERRSNSAFVLEPPRRAAFGLFAPVVLFFLVLFAAVLFMPRQFAYRDVCDTYFPLFRQVQSEWNAGRLPLWSPHENLGQPLAADPIASIFYPPKLLFFLTAFFPGAYGACFTAYILLHFPLAFFGMYRLIRRWGDAPLPAVFAATAWTFSGQVFFQYSNPIYLIGAAWLPWGIDYGDRLITEGGVRNLLALAAVLALSVTGGEPQIAYFTGLMLCGLLFCRWTNERANRKNVITPPADSEPPEAVPRTASALPARRPFLSRLFLLIAAGLLGGLLSAVAVVPASNFTRLSNRQAQRVPVSIWDIPGYFADKDKESENPYFDRLDAQIGLTSEKIGFWDGFLNRQPELELKNLRYRYSVTPWQLLELAAPNLCGQTLSGPYRGWSIFLPQGESLWTRSLYMGIIPLVLAFSAFRLFRRVRRCRDDAASGAVSDVEPPGTPKDAEPVRRWASWLVVLGVLAAIGGFGPLWFARLFDFLALGHAQDLRLNTSDPVGGFYWLLNVFLPKFASFRYPGKLMTVAVFGLSVLSAFGWEKLASKRFRRVFWGIFALEWVGLFCAVLFGHGLLAPLAGRNSATFGLFDVAAAARLVMMAFFQPILVLGLFYALLRMSAGERFRRAVPFALVALLCVDLYLANRTLVPTVPTESLLRGSAAAGEIRDDAALSAPPDETSASVPTRFYYHADYWMPNIGKLAQGKEKIDAFSSWKRAALRPMFQMSESQALLVAPGAMFGRDVGRLQHWLIHQRNHLPPGQALAIGDVLAFYGMGYVVAFPNATEYYTGTTPLEGSLAGCRNELERAERLRELTRKEWPFSVTVFKTNRAARRLRIEHDTERADAAKDFVPYMPSPGESAVWVEYLPNRLTFDATLQSDGSVVAAEQFWPGWRASYRPLGSDGQPDVTAKAVPIEIEKAYGAIRRVALPAGSYRVTMEYRPNDLFAAAAVSAVTLFLTLAAALFAIWRSNKSRKKGQNVS